MQQLYLEANDWVREWDYAAGGVSQTTDAKQDEAMSPEDKQARREALEKLQDKVDDEIPF